MSNAIVERVHQDIGNLVQTFNIQQTYIDKNYPWKVILAAEAFVICSKTKQQKVYIPGQILIGLDYNLFSYWLLRK